MKIYLNQSVYDAALDRIRWLFDEFPNVIVNFSGGKDSTVVFNLSMQVAEEKGRLPLKVYFLDQEAEWQVVIDYMRTVMYDPRVEPLWLQVPFRIYNATSNTSPWLYAWEPGKHWVREKEPISIKENRYGTDRFFGLYEAFTKVDYPHVKTVRIAGVRAEESPARRSGLTSYETYKGATWGLVGNKKLQHFTMYPLYDWSYTDIWKAIHEHHWPYCQLYDYMYQHGIPVRQMRVSNVHHETAVKTLFYLQEIEPDTWNRITARITGLSSAGHLQQDFYRPHELPFMFKDWWEYRDHLLENMITDPAIRETLRRQFAQNDANYLPEAQDELVKTEIKIILTQDYTGTAFDTFHAGHARFAKHAGKMGNWYGKVGAA